MITRGFPNIVATDVPQAKEWYIGLLGWVAEFESDWFVHLRAPDAAGVELGILAAGHEIVPRGLESGTGGLESGTAGVLLTFVVDNVDDTFAQAQTAGYDIVEEPRDLFYGQRRMVLRDPDGTLIDISSECEPSSAFLASLR